MVTCRLDSLNDSLISPLLFLQNSAEIIKNTLDQLGAENLKSFKFKLKNYKKEGYPSVPQSKLENKDIIDIATLVTDHYGSEKALKVTQEILQKINQRDLVSQLDSHVGKKIIITSVYYCHNKAPLR